MNRFRQMDSLMIATGIAGVRHTSASSSGPEGPQAASTRKKLMDTRDRVPLESVVADQAGET